MGVARRRFLETTNADPVSYADPVVLDQDFAFVSEAIWVGGSGDVSVVMEGSGLTRVFKGCQAGTFLAVHATRVTSAGTTATNLLCCYN